MNTHSIDLIRYCARSRGNSTIYLGTAGSHGNEQLQVTQGKGWEGLTVQVVFHPCKVAVQLPANGVLDVPWEATARPLTALQGRIVFQGFDQDRLVNSTDLAYTVASHSPALGRDEQPYTPGIVEGVLNQMAADKDAILQAAQQTGQAKEAAAASAAAAASSAANAQQSAGAANTSAGQAAASASQAAGSAAAANETLTQVQTAGQEAQQKVKDAETEALDKIAAAAPALPAVSSDAAWQSVTVKPDGTGYNLAAMAPIEATIRPTVTGNPAVCKDSTAWAFQGLAIYGKSIQDGTPSPENPVPIVSAGDGGNIITKITGLNILPYPYTDGQQQNRAGITFTVNNDGTITAKGTATNNASFALLGKFENNVNVPKGYLNGCPTKDGSCDIRYVQSDFTIYTDNGSGVYLGNLFTGYGYIECRVLSGHTVDVVFKPMINLIGLNEEYEPYKSQSLTISTHNGLPGIPVDSGGNYTDASGQRRWADIIDYNNKKKYQYINEVVVDGTNKKFIASNEMFWDLNKMSPLNILNIPNQFLNAYFPKDCFSVNAEWDFIWTTPQTMAPYFETVDELNAFCVQKNTEGNPLTIMYVMNTPIETPLSEEELAAYRALHTYDGTTVVSTAEPVAGIEASYVMDGNKYRESVDKRLAALEAAQTGI